MASPWRIEVLPIVPGRQDVCEGCGPRKVATGQPHMFVTSVWGTFGLCLTCAAELRDAFLHHTQQR